MPLVLRLLLFLGSVANFFFVVRLIRKSRMRIEDSIFWIFFTFLLIVLSLFPKIAFVFSDLFHFQSPINLVYLVIIFVLIVNQFLLTQKISNLTIKQKELTQSMALAEILRKENKDNPNGEN